MGTVTPNKNKRLEAKYESHTVYFDTKGLSSYIHRTEGAIRNMVMRRAIPFRKAGGRLVFLEEEIDEWINLSEGATLDEILDKAI